MPIKLLNELKKTFFRFLTILSPTINIKARYRQIFKKRLDFDNPQTIEEKLQWLKAQDYNHNPDVAQCSDKVAVRDYVKGKGYGHLLNDVIGIYEKVEEIPWEQLPNRFALKWNFGATFNLICDDKSELDIEEAKRKLKKWGNEKYWLDYAEMQYKYCKKKLICEKYLDTNQGFLPYDYKLYCFHGKAKAILFIANRDNDKKGGFFSPDWGYLGPASKGYRRLENDSVQRPHSLTEMIACAEALSQDFPFVRVDFYQYQDRAIFGEMTFTPAAGLYLSKIDIDGKPMGELLNIQSYKSAK